jgi:peptidyl-Lys metalloendopeptidase
MVVLSVLALQACAGTGDGEDVAAEEQAVRRADLRVSLSLAQAAYAAYEPVRATVTIANAGRNAVKLLGWMLPAEDLEEPLFRVERDGARVAFTGPRYKRAGVGAGDFVLLAAGASLTRSVDLAAFYDFSATGDYRVSARALLHQLHHDAAGAGERRLLGGDRHVGRRGGLPRRAALGDAALHRVVRRLHHRPLGPRRGELLGDRGGVRDPAGDHRRQVQEAVLAYVYPSQPYKIYVCKVFWSAPVSGTDSKGGTLIHEMSHFDAVAATDDVVYGQSACRSLADSDPDDAVRNADSHEYFAENTPFLP